MLVLRAFAAWLLLSVLAVLNGILRETVLLPNMSNAVAYVLSGLLLSSLIVTTAVALAGWLRLRTRLHCLYVGLLWVCLTLVFEFGLGGIVQQRSWAEMLEAYTFKDGNIWPIVLAVTLFAPLVAAHTRSLLQNAHDRGV
ncbi:hypothetical protein ARNL5_02916 [Anaerolineae bacterium]|nr:hypothetical protein ARNL5_02916 [Anaerolineae bacterium]